MNLFINIFKKYTLLISASVFFSILVSTYIFNQYDFFKKNHRINSQVTIPNSNLVSNYLNDTLSVQDFKSLFYKKELFNFWQKEIFVDHELYKNYNNIITFEYLKDNTFLPSLDIIIDTQDYKIAKIIKFYSEFIETKFTDNIIIKLDKALKSASESNQKFIRSLNETVETTTPNNFTKKLFDYKMDILIIKSDIQFNNGKIIIYRDPFEYSRLESNISPLLLYFFVGIFIFILSIFILLIYEELRKKS